MPIDSLCSLTALAAGRARRDVSSHGLAARSLERIGHANPELNPLLQADGKLALSHTAVACPVNAVTRRTADLAPADLAPLFAG